MDTFVQMPSYFPRGCTPSRKGPSLGLQLQQRVPASILGLSCWQCPDAFPPPHLPKLCLTSPEPHLGPVFPGGQRQRPVAGSQVAFPTQSQSCRHPSPCVPSSQPVWGEGTGQGRAACLHPGLLLILGGTAGGRYLPGSAGHAHPRGSGSGRWQGRRQHRARSRSAAGSRPRGNPGGNLGGRAC